MLQKRYKVITKKNITSIFLKKITLTCIFFFSNTVHTQVRLTANSI